MALVDLVQDDDVVLREVVVRRHLSQKEPVGQKEQLRSSRLCLLEAGLVGDLGAVLVQRLVGDSPRQRHACNSPWLRARDLCVSGREQVLRQLEYSD